jgi:hypothetical protein
MKREHLSRAAFFQASGEIAKISSLSGEEADRGLRGGNRAMTGGNRRSPPLPVIIRGRRSPRRLRPNQRRGLVMSSPASKHAWDGACRSAYFDNGEPLDSSCEHGCQIDSLPQSWSALSGCRRRSHVGRRDFGIRGQVKIDGEKMRSEKIFSSGRTKGGRWAVAPGGFRPRGGQPRRWRRLQSCRRGRPIPGR